MSNNFKKLSDMSGIEISGEIFELRIRVYELEEEQLRRKFKLEEENNLYFKNLEKTIDES